MERTDLERPAPSAAEAVLQLQAVVLSQPAFDRAATAFATRLAQLLHLSRAAVGMVEAGGAAVVATSHATIAEDRHEDVRGLAAAMDEAIDQAATIVFPPAAGALRRVTAAHAELARRAAVGVCSVPVVDLGAIAGAVTLERPPDRPFTEAETVLIEHLVSLVGPVLVLKREAERPWWTRTKSRLIARWRALSEQQRRRTRLAGAGAALALAAVLFLPLGYEVSAPARLEGELQRALVAAADGFLQQVSVRPGDVVSEGQVLAELAQQDLQLQRGKWESELAQQTSAYGAAMARADRALLMVNYAKAAEARAQLELVEQQIVRAQVRAPFDGIVLSGDLTQSLGAPVQRGGVLMVIAPRDRFRLIVEVDERDIADIVPGAAGRLRLAALPGEPYAFRAERVAPLALARDGRNFFEVEGKLDTPSPALRPGLQGVARIEAGRRPLVAAVTGRLLTWLKLTLWSWGL